ncbi:hypothetical protein B7494_g5760 [Chlorociboria aeruginascens]|nr:hypothetical protein B7494_g5760 [Chlorociboria aeruginascens]
MTYNGRRGPNVSEYIANLNAIPSAQDLQSQENFTTNLEDDLAMFTNTQFFDFDSGHDADPQLANYGVDGSGGTAASDSDMKAIDFNLPSGDFPFADFNTFTPSTTYGNDRNPQVLPPVQTSNIFSASSTASPTSGLVSPQGEKRKIDSVTDFRSPEGFEESSRVAAEEDKRRRNTAASARFRVKKKQREQALERSAKEMSDKVSALEGRISQLETENKWLKNLITEKNESKEDIQALYKKYSQDVADRKGSERKDGVGTKA